MPDNRNVAFRLNYGYRTLIDWSPSQGFNRASQFAGGGFTQGRSGLVGPQNLETHRPPLWQPDALAGKAIASRGKKLIPGGSRQGSGTATGGGGFYYDVRNFRTPQLSKSGFKKMDAKEGGYTSIDPRTEIMQNLGRYMQQWLYLAAENMRGNLNAAAADPKNDVQPSEVTNINRYILSQDAGMRRMGRSMMTGADYAHSIRRVKSPSFITDNDTFKGEQLRVDPFGTAAVNAGYFPQYEWEQDFPQAITGQREIPQPFKRMFKGLTGKKNWLVRFAENITSGGPSEIKWMAKRVEDSMIDFATFEDYASSASVRKALRELGPTINVEKESGGGGQATAEKAIAASHGGPLVSFGQKGFSPVASDISDIGLTTKDGTLVTESRSKPIDIEFKKLLSFHRFGAETKIKRMDITSSFLVRTNPQGRPVTSGHHGTGKSPTYQQSYPNAFDAFAKIQSHYNSDRIPKYNALMKLMVQGVQLQYDDKFDRRRKADLRKIRQYI